MAAILFGEWERVHLPGDQYQFRTMVLAVPGLVGTALDEPDKCVLVSFVGSRDSHCHMILPWSIDEDRSIAGEPYHSLLTPEIRAEILESLPPIPWPGPAPEVSS